MKNFYTLLLASLLAFSTSNVLAQTAPCSLTGGSVYIDHTTSPWLMNATVNGVSMYSYSWVDTNGLVISTVNQTPFYTQWCVTIVDNQTGCDTTICQDCTADPTALCACFMIYMPVCGCDGVQYANSCEADCADVPWTPAVPNGTLGGFLPCTQPSTCDVEITGDSIVCEDNSSQVLTAVPTGNGTPPYTYLWGSGQSNISMGIGGTGTYCVAVTDANGCIATECITVTVQNIPIFSAPSPPIICLGDSIVLEIDTIGLSNIVWVPNTLLTPPVHRIVDFPTISTTYVVEAVDSLFCAKRGEIFVTVDSCTAITPSWDCINGVCKDLGTGIGVYSDSLVCVAACVVVTPSWDCFSGMCKDLGTGIGVYSDSLVCVASCVVVTPSWDCFSGMCKDLGTGMGVYSDSLVCVADCILNAVEEQNISKRLLKVIDFLGREEKGGKNEVLFYIYDDGTVEKKIVIE